MAMSHCYSVRTEIDGEEKEICVVHAEGNETLRKDVESGNVRTPTQEEVLNAVKHYEKYGDGPPKAAIESFDDKDLSPVLVVQIDIGGKKP
jgi:hypothetical protein